MTDVPHDRGSRRPARPAVLERFLGQQRWFAGKTGPGSSPTRPRIGWLRREMPAVQLALVDRLLRRRRHRDLPGAAGALRRAGRAPRARAGRRRRAATWAYDALHDKEVTAAVVRRHRDGGHRRRLPLPSRPERRGAAAGGAVARHRRRAEQHLGGLRRRRDPQGVPQGLAGPEPRHRGARRSRGRGQPRTSRRCSAGSRAAGPARRIRRTAGDASLAMVQEFLQNSTEGWATGQDQRPRPVRRGRPARRRGRRRLRRRGGPARRGHRGGAPGPRARPADRDAGPPRSWPRSPTACAPGSTGPPRRSRRCSRTPTGCGRPSTTSPAWTSRSPSSGCTATSTSAR